MLRSMPGDRGYLEGQRVPGEHLAAIPTLDDEIQAALGRRLGDLYRPVMSEPVPAHLLDLLDRLASAMSPVVPDANPANPEDASPSS